jgi:hypothetical protein
MNPWTTVKSFYGDILSRFGMDAAAVLLCRVMEGSYIPGTMPVGSNPYAWCLAQLSEYAPNELVSKMARDWNTRAR